MRNLSLRLVVPPALLILLLASCLGGGGTNDNPAAGVEPANSQLQQDSGSELLVNDNFDLPTEDATLDNDDAEFELTGTPDVDSELFGNDSSDDALFGGGTGDSGALDAGSGDSTTDLFDQATATVTPSA